MFNDIDKKVRFTGPLNIIMSVLFALLTATTARVVKELEEYTKKPIYYSHSTVVTVSVIIGAIGVIVGIITVWLAIAFKIGNTKPFHWLKGAAKVLRTFAWILLIGGAIGVFLFCFWSFFNVKSDNAVVNATTYALASLIPAVCMAYGFCTFLYALGNAADDGGDAKYVQESKLFGMEPMHAEEDTRKVCPDCGTRTDRHTCPNCGAKID